MSKMSELHIHIQEALDFELQSAGFHFGYQDLGFCILETCEYLHLEPEQVINVLMDRIRGGSAQAKRVMEEGD